MAEYGVLGTFSADAAIGHNWVAVRIAGEFDVACEAAAASIVTRLLDEHPDVRTLTLDMSGITLFTSSGVRFLAGVYARCFLGDVAVELRTSPCVERVLALTDTDTMLAALEPLALAA